MMEVIQTQAQEQWETTKALLATTSRLDRLESLIETYLHNATQHSPNTSLSHSHLEPHHQLSPFGPLRVVKIDFPQFSRNEPLEWIYKAECFFKIYEIPEDQQVAIASVHIEGRALPWFQMIEKANQVPNWLALSTATVWIDFKENIYSI